MVRTRRIAYLPRDGQSSRYPTSTYVPETGVSSVRCLDNDGTGGTFRYARKCFAKEKSCAKVGREKRLPHGFVEFDFSITDMDDATRVLCDIMLVRD